MQPDPILRAVVTPAQPGQSPQALAPCDWCEGPPHVHSAEPGHRVAHCHRKESPYRATGYVLDIVGEAAAPETLIPAGLLVGHGRFYEAVEASASKLRAVLVRHVLGRMRFGRMSISIRDSGWTIDTGVTDGSRPRWINGVGLLGLFSALYGVSRGVVGVRLFEVVFGEAFNAQERIALVDLIEGAAKRRGEVSEDRP
ncbi:hypothetical protein MEME101129_28205 [Methylobacterium mesophilicum]